MVHLYLSWLTTVYPVLLCLLPVFVAQGRCAVLFLAHLRLGGSVGRWPAYTNEAIFLFHATTLVFFSGFPAMQQKGDALYYANYFADKTFNPFVPYPILAMYFIILTLIVISIFGVINTRLNRHLPSDKRPKLKVRPQVIR